MGKEKKLALVLLVILASGSLIDQSFAAITEVKKTSSDIAALDQFSQSISISGDFMVVGVPEDDDNGPNSGAVYVFKRNAGGLNSWDQVTKITPMDGSASDFFGTSVSISGDFVVVGASGGTSGSGSAYIFDRNEPVADNWGEIKKLTASDAAANDQFGHSASISGNTIVIGAFGNDDSGDESGSAYIFDRNEPVADNWGEVEILTADDGAESDNFGISVSVSGDSAIVGAFADDTFTGSAYVFDRNEPVADNWGQVEKLTASDAAINDEFGISVSISGDFAAVGAHLNDDDGTNSGSAYIFDRNEPVADNWGEIKKLTASDADNFDQFGFATSIFDDTLAVGAFGDDGFIGSAYIFDRNEPVADNWGEVTKHIASDASALDDFGRSISTTSSTLAVGAPENDNFGFAYIFFETVVPCEASLDGNQMVGPVVTDATGAALLTLKLSSNLLEWNPISFTDLTSEVTTIFIHGPAPPGANAVVQLDAGDLSDVAPFGTTGEIMGSTVIDNTQKSNLLNELWYIVVRNEAFPAGEIRGQIICDVERQVGGTLIPIDTTALLLSSVQTSMIWWLPAVVIVTGAGIGLVLLRRK